MSEYLGDFIKYGSEQPVSLYGDMVQRAKLESVNIEGIIFSTDIYSSSNGRERLVGRMIIKDQGEERMYLKSFYDAWPEILLEKHAWLKSHGFPVVPTLRADVINNRILMTDISENGRKKIFDKHNPMKAKGDIVNITDVSDQARMIAESAFAGGNGIFLDRDAYSVVVDEAGVGRVMLLDLGLHTTRISNYMKIGLFDSGKFSIGDAMGQAELFLRLLMFR